MLKVGLTGSIAVGKSYVCDCFRKLGCHVLDADNVARDVVEIGTNGHEQIAREFGSGVLQQNGQIDRKALGAIIFADEAKRQLLNSIVHPLVIDAQDRWLNALEKVEPEAIAIVDAALMIEADTYRRFDKIIVVWCEPEIQLARLMQRDNLSEADAQKKIAAQMPQEEKKEFADYLVDTSGDLEDVRVQTAAVFARLRSNSF